VFGFPGDVVVSDANTVNVHELEDAGFGAPRRYLDVKKSAKVDYGNTPGPQGELLAWARSRL
jgi:hypothetical protein